MKAEIRLRGHILWLISFIGVLVLYFMIIEAALSYDGGYNKWDLYILPNLWLLASSMTMSLIGKFEYVTFNGGRPSITVKLVSAVCILLFIINPFFRSTDFVNVIGFVGSLSLDNVYPYAGFQGFFLALGIPVFEEFFFRGVFLNFLARNFKAPLAVILVSLIFGLLHLQSGLNLSFQMILLSIIWSWLTISSRSILWAVMFHIAWNTSYVTSQSAGGFAVILHFSVAVLLIFLFFQGVFINDLTSKAIKPGRQISNA